MEEKEGLHLEEKKKATANNPMDVSASCGIPTELCKERGLRKPLCLCGLCACQSVANPGLW